MTARSDGAAPPPHVSILIITYNSNDLAPRCFACVEAQTLTNFEVIVVDNASPDGPPSLPRDPRFRLIPSLTNLGFAGGNNLAAKHARGKWLAALNPDAFAEPDWLEQLVTAAERTPGATMAGSLQLSGRREDRLDGAGDCYHAAGVAWRGLYNAPRTAAPPTGEVFGPCAAAALYRRDAFERVGGFDEDFFCYHEDVDLAFRMRLAGGRCVQSAEARVVHVGSASSDVESDFATYHGVRNRLWTFVKSMPAPLLVLLAVPHALVSCLFLVRAFVKGIGGPTLRGLSDGLKGLPKQWRKRSDVRAITMIGAGAIARAFTWSPWRLLTRGHDVRPL